MVLLTFLKMFMPRSEERSGTADLRRLVSETLEKASELRDFSSSLHFMVRSLIDNKGRLMIKDLEIYFILIVTSVWSFNSETTKFQI